MTNGNSAEHEEQQCTNPLTCPNAYWEVDHWECPVCICADGGKGEAQNVMNIPLDAAATMADYVPQAECAPREAQPVAYMFEWPDGVSLALYKQRYGEKPLRVIPPYAAPMPERADAEKDAARWKFESTESDGRIWLTIHHPGGAKASLSARATTDEGRNSTICAQVIRDLVGGTQAPTPERAQESMGIPTNSGSVVVERAQESAGVRLTPEQSGAIQIAISILTPGYELTANRLLSILDANKEPQP